MINENAPGVLLLSVGKALSDKEQAQLKELKAKTELKEGDKKQINSLYTKYETATEDVYWLPIPVNTNAIPLVSTKYEASANRAVDMVDGKSYLTNLTDTQSITFVSDTTVFSNALIFILDYIFQQKELMPSLQYYSDELIVGRSYLLSYKHTFDPSGNQNTILITLQKTSDDPIQKFTKKVKKLDDQIVSLF